MSRRRLTVLLALVAGLLSLLATATPAYAHSRLLGSNPADRAVLDTRPASLELRFDEPVQVVPAATRLYAPGAPPRELTATARGPVVTVQVPDDLPQGRSSVAYHVVSADGHPVSGVLSFTWGVPGATAPTGPNQAEPVPTEPVPTGPGPTGPVPSGPASTETAPTEPPVPSASSTVTDLLVSGTTAVQVAGVLTAWGVLVAGLLLIPRRQRVGAGFVETGSGGAVSGGAGFGGVRRLVRCSWGVALAASLLLVPLSALQRQGRSPIELWPVSDWAAAIDPRTLVALAAVLVATLGAGLRRGSGTPAVLAATVGLSAPIWVGHSSAPTNRLWLVSADLLHLAAGGFWIGGLLWLVWSVTPAGRRRLGPNRVAHLVSRFSTRALVSVLALVCSGTILALCELPSPQALLTSPFGRQLVLKVVVAAGVVALAAWNRFSVLPTLAGAAASTQDAAAGIDPRSSRRTTPADWRRLRLGVIRELALLALVLSVTGFLTQQSPQPHDQHTGSATSQHAAGGPDRREFSVESQGLQVQGRLSGSGPGQHQLELDVRQHGRPVEPGRLQILARLPAERLGPIQAVVRDDAVPGRCLADLDLPAPGRWQLQIDARISDFEQPVAIIEITIG